MNIEDGTGDGYSLGITEENRALTDSLVRSQLEKHADKGNVFWFISDFVALTTTASFNGILYIKNTSPDRTLYIDFLRTCADQITQWKLIKNPTTGTLMSAGTAFIPVNTKFDSGLAFIGTVNQGADAKTITDGDLMGTWQNNIGHSTNRFDGAIILPPDKSMALTCKPAVAGDVCVTIMGWQI